MPRRKRPAKTRRSEHWMRVAVNEAALYLNELLRSAFRWSEEEEIEWISPIASDQYAEYYDLEFLSRLGLGKLTMSLDKFWPKSGPRWDGLAKSASGKLILIEAKAYIEEGVDYQSKAGPNSLSMINAALNEAKRAFGAADEAPWGGPFYQYATRLAHLYFLVEKNRIDAYLVFLYFANAPDVPEPCSVEQWEGARRLIEKCLGLGRHRYRDRIATIIIDVGDIISNKSLRRKR